jgi:hypothetical protein
VVCQHGLITLILLLLLTVLIVLAVRIIGALSRWTATLVNVQAVDVAAKESGLLLLRL